MNDLWRIAIEDYLAGRRSPETRRAYALAIDKFGAYCAAHHITLAEATPRHIATWIASMHGITTVNTIRARLAALSAFYDWIAKHTQPPLRSDNPTRAVAWPQHQAPRRTARDRALDADQANMLIDQADTRARALLALMCVEALRCAEATSLKWNDLDGHMLIVVGKGGKRRFTTIADVTAGLVEDWRISSGATAGSDAYLFPGRNGHLSTDAAAVIVKRLGAAIGVDLSPHPLRATAITLMLQGGAALHEAQRAAGHSSPSTTERYIKQAPSTASSKTGIRRPRRDS